MDSKKPQRRTNIFDYWNVKKKMKFTEVTNSLPKISRTQFEDLANELYYEIFNYLDLYHAYKAFYNTNIRFQNLLINSNQPIKINISSMSKSTFQRYYRHMIMSNKHRIASMYLSNPFVVDIIFSPVRIVSDFNRLERLVFDRIKSKYLPNILHYLASLPNLTSLTIIPIEIVSNQNDLIENILRLPALKYCRISLKQRFASTPLTISSNITSPLEHLVIDYEFNLKQLNTFLSYVPQLRRLTCSSLFGTNILSAETSPTVLKNLTHISFDTIGTTFNHFEELIRNLTHQLQVLCISLNSDREYLDANRWEYLIKSFIPQLRIFDFQHTDFIESNTNENRAWYDSILQQFSSSFWHKRKWFFGYRFEKNMLRDRVIFYSKNCYRY
ncbi:hypothetical protein I4U23_020134 [Adineta vaga]|nr:hypothetical protein I4U23_020134 [Adineta vaga]